MLESVLMSREGNSRQAVAAILIAIAALSCVPLSRATSRERSQRTQTILPSLTALPVLADLDGDHVPDSVNLDSSGFHKTIDIRFANLRIREVTFAATSADRGTLIAKDIDNDGDVDLIWVTGRDKSAAVVLINDGKGDFERATDNSPYASQLNALLSNSDPSNQDSIQAGHHRFGLSSSSFPDINVTLADRLSDPAHYTMLVLSFNGFSDRAAFLSYLHKRGPPAIPS